MKNLKVLLSLCDFEIGGIQISSINFMNCILNNFKNVDLDVFILAKNGPLLNKAPKSIKIIEACKELKPFGVSQGKAKKYGLKFWFKRTLIAVKCKVFGNKSVFSKCLKKQDNVGDYDLAIAFAPSSGTHSMSCGRSEIVLQKVRAKKKVVFFHNDILLSGLNEEYCISQLKQFDKIYCVSKSCADNMKTILPEMSAKIDYMYNFQNDKNIVESSKMFRVDYPKSFNIVSVSRISEEKAHIRSLRIFKRLHEEGYVFNWNIVGDGKNKKDIEEYIKKNNMQSYVFLYGNQNNPYPFMKSADLFYLGSYHEAAPMVFAESMLLGVPVLSTNTSSAKELIGDYGFVCDNEEIGIYNAIKEILENKELVNTKKLNLKEYKSTNEVAYSKLKNLLDGEEYDS